MEDKTWVDFRSVKRAVSIQQVLEHYQIDWLRKRGDELRGRCPIHQGEGTNTFHVNLDRSVFHCFSCKARGNVLDFVAAMEQCSVRDAAIKLRDWFVSGQSASEPAEERTRAKEKPAEQPAANRPLTFQLKGIDPEHPYLAERGISRDLADKFGVGFFPGNGSMHGRVVIPIHNERGELVAYAGRSIDGSEPKYKLPTGFQKSLELFNLHRVVGESGPDQQVVVVEGFFDCMKVTGAGFPCIALMGSSLSENQRDLLVSRFARVVFLFDGDTAGRKAMDQCIAVLGRYVWVRGVTLQEGEQPDHLSAEELSSLLGILSR